MAAISSVEAAKILTMFSSGQDHIRPLVSQLMMPGHHAIADNGVDATAQQVDLVVSQVQAPQKSRSGAELLLDSLCDIIIASKRHSFELLPIAQGRA